MGSSTGALLVEDDEACAHPQGDPPPRRVSIPRTSTASTSASRLRDRGRSALASGLARRDRRADGDAAAGPACARDRQAHARAAHLDRAGDGVSRRPQGRRLGRGDAASPHAGRARMLRAARHLCADEPAGARRRHREASGRGIEQGIVDVLGSDHAPHTLEEKAKTYPASPSGHDRRADAGADHARSRQCRAAVAGALRRSHQRRAARLFGIACKGRIAAGYDADLTIVDLKRRDSRS